MKSRALRMVAVLVLVAVCAAAITGCARSLPTGQWVESSSGEALKIEKEWMTTPDGTEYAYKVTGDTTLQVSAAGNAADVRYELSGDTLTLRGQISGVFNLSGSSADRAAQAERDRLKAEAEAAQAQAEAEAAQAQAEAEAAAKVAAEAEAKRSDCIAGRGDVLNAVHRYASKNWGYYAGGYETGDVYPSVQSIESFSSLVSMLKNSLSTSEYSDFGRSCPDGGGYELAWSAHRPLLTIRCSLHGDFSTDDVGF